MKSNQWLKRQKKDPFVINAQKKGYLSRAAFKLLEIDKLEYSNDNERINANKIPRNIIARTLQHNRNVTSKLKKVIPKKLVDYVEFLLYKKADKAQLKDVDRFLLIIRDFNFCIIKKHILIASLKFFALSGLIINS